jgi:hypothetical protein
VRRNSFSISVLAGLEGRGFGWDWHTTAGAMGSKVDNPTRGAKNAVNYMNAVLCGEYKSGGVNSPSNAVQ